MKLIPSWLSSRRTMKRLGQLQHAAGAGAGWILTSLPFFDSLGAPRGRYDYAADVGDGTGSSVLMAPIQFVQRALPESPAIVQRMVGDEWEIQPGHPAAELIDTPNPYYSGLQLWAATVFAYLVFGNAYWAIVRDGRGQPVRLWWIAPWLIEPRWPRDGSEFITHYEYRPAGGEPVRLEVEDVVHFRHGISPANPRKGISPIGSVLRDVWVDDEASEFIADLLRNSGVPGIIVSPDGDVAMAPDEIKEFKRRLLEEIGGSNRGKPLVASGKTKVDKISFSPEELNLTAATDRPEERVCALIGIPAAVIGFSAGLEQTKVGATMKELRQLAWSNGIMPMQRVFSDELNRSLLTAFRTRRRDERVAFDHSQVAALAEDRDAIFKRADIGVQGGWLTVAHAKRMAGLEPDPGDDIYLRKISVFPVPVGQQQIPPTQDSSQDPQRGTRSASAVRLKQLDEDLAGDNHHTLFEREIAQRARNGRRVEAIAAQHAFLELLDRQRGPLEERFTGELRAFFLDMGAKAEGVAEPILTEHGFKQAEPGDSIIVDRVLEAMGIAQLPATFAEIHQRHYIEVANETAAAMEVFSLATDLPDTVARAVAETGGRRAGLVDLTSQTKAALFRAITEGRAEGEGAAQLAKRIGEIVPRGPWSSVDIRSLVIARTETKHAQNVSTIAAARDQDVATFRVFDARLGPTDIVCEELDGALVTPDEADQLAFDEHPNGTRSFTPHFLPPES